MRVIIYLVFSLMFLGQILEAQEPPTTFYFCGHGQEYEGLQADEEDLYFEIIDAYTPFLTDSSHEIHIYYDEERTSEFSDERHFWIHETQVFYLFIEDVEGNIIESYVLDIIVPTPYELNPDRDIEAYYCDNDRIFDLTQYEDFILMGNEYDVSFNYSLLLQRVEIDNPENFEILDIYDLGLNHIPILVRIYDNSSGCFQNVVIGLIKLSVSDFSTENITSCGEDITLHSPDGMTDVQWSENVETSQQNNSEVTITQSGTYTVTFIEPNGCTNSKTYDVEFLDAPNVYGIVLHQDFLEIQYDGNSNTEFSLDNIHWQNSPVFDLPRSVNNLVVYARNNSICDGLEFEIHAENIDFDLEYYNVITPNGDGYNDTWDLNLLQFFNDFDLKIYDRYGKCIFESDESNKRPWDGTYLGRPLPSTSYWFTLSIEGKVIFKGNVLILKHY